MKTIPEASVGRQGPCFKTVPNREDQSHSPGVPTTGPAKDEQTHQHSSPCINVTSLIKKKMAMPPQSHTQHGNMLTTALKVPSPLLEKKLEGNTPSAALGLACRGCSVFLPPFSRMFCFQSQRDWWTNLRDVHSSTPSPDGSGQINPGSCRVEATQLGARTAPPPSPLHDSCPLLQEASSPLPY